MDDDLSTLSVAQVVADHHAAVYRYAYRLTGSETDAEDLTQHTFLTAQRKLGQLRNVESTRSWLFTILRNAFFKSCQKRRPIPAANVDMDVNNVAADFPEDPVVSSEQLQQALDELPEKFRVALLMFYYEELSYREIAERLHVPMGTVMSRLARAKRYLRSKLFEPVAESADH